MAKILATGAKIAIGTAFGTQLTMTGVSNATEAVATLSDATTIAVNDVVQITSGWGLLDGRVARVKAKAGNDITLEGVDTSDTVKFPTGTGGGSVKEVTAFTDITQIAGVSPSGGEQQYADSSDLDDVDDKQIPSSRSAQAIELTVHDDPSLSWYAAVKAAEGVARPLRITFQGGSKLYAGAYYSLRETPDISRNETLKARLSITYAARPVRYAT